MFLHLENANAVTRTKQGGEINVAGPKGFLESGQNKQKPIRNLAGNNT